MNCQEVRERLPALIDDELEAAERTEVEKHLEGCEDCRAEKHRQEQFTTRVKTSLEDLRPSELFVKGVLDKLDDPARKKQEERETVRRTKISLVAAGAVVAVVLLAALFLALVRRPPSYAGEVTGCTRGKAWMIAAGSSEAQPVPLRVPEGALLRTDEGGKIVMKLPDGAELTVHEKTSLRLDPSPALVAGAVTFASARQTGLVVGKVGVRSAGGRIQVSLQYGDTVVVKVEKGAAELLYDSPPSAAPKVQECAEGETWQVPADKSKPPEKVK